MGYSLTQNNESSAAPFPPKRILPVLAPSLFWPIGSALANDVEESKLPPPASLKINFARDIKPILDNHCLKCHSNEKPRSNFRLTVRESALKGGSHGVDIIPG